VSILPADIRAVLLKENAYGHEMRVGHVIYGFTIFETEHGGTYDDDITGKPRQFDYRCHAVTMCPVTSQRRCLWLAIECKNIAPAVPLIVCGCKRRSGEAFHNILGFNAEKGTASTRQLVGKDSIYEVGGFVGKSLVRIQSDKKPMVCSGDGDVYDKWAQAVSSAVFQAEVANLAAQKGKDSVESAILPLLVVPDGTLWRVCYDGNGEITDDPVIVDECQISIRRTIKLQYSRPKSSFLVSHVHIFTLSGLKQFLNSFRGEAAWGKVFGVKPTVSNA